MNLIAAVDQNWGIGRAGELLAHIPEDLEYFRQQTVGKTVIMGRKTLESLPGGRPLASRKNIVLSRRPEFAAEGAVVCRGAGEVLKLTAGWKPEEVFVIGGGEVYRLLLPYCDTALITFIDRDLGPEVYLPRLDKSSEWRLEETKPGRPGFGFPCEFRIYRRIGTD